MKKLNKYGFTSLELVLIVVAIGIVGFTGWFVVHAKNATDKSLADTAKSQPAVTNTKTSAAVTDFASCKAAAGSIMQETYPEQCVTKDGKKFTDTLQKTLTLTNSKLSLAYDPALWDVKSDSGVDSRCQAKTDSGTLHYRGTSYSIVINLGGCGGKGGGSCSDNLGCLSDFKNLGAVKVSTGKEVYVIANGTKNADATEWKYGLYLTNSKDCADYVCALSLDGDIAGGSAFGVYDVSYGAPPAGPKSLSDFIARPEVQAATTVLLTAHIAN
jgi:hypothetical protein